MHRGPTLVRLDHSRYICHYHWWLIMDTENFLNCLISHENNLSNARMIALQSPRKRFRFSRYVPPNLPLSSIEGILSAHATMRMVFRWHYLLPFSIQQHICSTSIYVVVFQVWHLIIGIPKVFSLVQCWCWSKPGAGKNLVLVKTWCWSKPGAGKKLVLVKSWCWSKAGAGKNLVLV